MVYDQHPELRCRVVVPDGVDELQVERDFRSRAAARLFANDEVREVRADRIGTLDPATSTILVAFLVGFAGSLAANEVSRLLDRLATDCEDAGADDVEVMERQPSREGDE